tara:strand:+ start:1138 stop:1302 length:165 start_codon:yes stop_codon:yes gene_type:complete
MIQNVSRKKLKYHPNKLDTTTQKIIDLFEGSENDVFLSKVIDGFKEFMKSPFRR